MIDTFKLFIRFLKDEKLIITHSDEYTALMRKPYILDNVKPYNYCYMLFSVYDDDFEDIYNKWQKILAKHDIYSPMSKTIENKNYRSYTGKNYIEEVNRLLSDNRAKAVDFSDVSREIERATRLFDNLLTIHSPYTRTFSYTDYYGDTYASVDTTASNVSTLYTDTESYGG